jgi:hypothetical protein
VPGAGAIWTAGDRRVGAWKRMGVNHLLLKQLHALLLAAVLLAVPPVLLYVAPWPQNYTGLPFIVFGGTALAMGLLHLQNTFLCHPYHLLSACMGFYRCCGMLVGLLGSGTFNMMPAEETFHDSCFKSLCQRPFFTELLMAVYFGAWAVIAGLQFADIGVAV